jgi:hypothetical protein
MTKNIGGISVSISAVISGFQKNIGKARGLLGSFNKSISKTNAVLGGLGVTLSSAAIVRGLTSTANKIADLSEASKRLGISTEVLGGLQLAAEEAGVSTSQLERSTLFMVRASERATEGVGRIAETYKRLGLNAKTLNAMSPDQQLATIASRISNLTTHQEKLNAATQIFGKGSASMLELLSQYPSRLAEATEAARQMGLIVKDDVAGSIEKAVDQFGRFKKALGGFGTAIVAQNADKIGGIAEVLEGFALSQHWKKGASPFDALFHGPASVLNNNVTSGPAFTETDPIRAARSAGGAAAAAEVRAQLKAAGLLPKSGKASAGKDRFSFGGFGMKLIENLFNKPMLGRPEVFRQKANPFIGHMPMDEAVRRRGIEPLEKVGGGASRLGLLGFAGPMMRQLQLSGLKLALSVRAQMAIANLHANKSKLPGIQPTEHRPLALHDPLSREGYAQRVRSLAQSEMGRLGQQQLTTQKKMEGHLNKIANQPVQFQFGIF